MRNINSKIYNNEWCSGKTYKTEANAEKAVKKAFNEIEDRIAEDHKDVFYNSFCMFTVVVDDGRYKPVIIASNKFGQQGIDLMHAGFQVIIK